MKWITSDDLLRNIGRVYDKSVVLQRPAILFAAEAEIVLPGSKQITTWHSPYAWIKEDNSHLTPGAIEETMSSLLPEGTLIVCGPTETNHFCVEFVDEDGEQVKIGKLWDDNPASGRYWCVMAKHIPSGKFVSTVRYDTMEGQYKPIHDKQIKELFFRDFPEHKADEYDDLRVVKYSLCKLLNAPIIN